jgi:hypothetical protein
VGDKKAPWGTPLGILFEVFLGLPFLTLNL